METIKELAQKGVPQIVNTMYEVHKTHYYEENNTASIILNNGYIVSIIHPMDSEDPNLWSVAVSDYDGYFDWDILKPFFRTRSDKESGCVNCHSEEDVCKLVYAIEAFAPII
ncbi:MAG: hypothetical protein PHC62_08670 [Candidatus Izemoplasmatales bacterium]|nr:hypothetical protein [Candidatus Izemoplasmatales bacterium]